MGYFGFIEPIKQQRIFIDKQKFKKNIMTHSSTLFSIICLCLAMMSGCDDNKKRWTDTPTSGAIHILADETYKPLLDSEVMVFESYYPEAKIHIHYKPALEVIQGMAIDSIRMLITSVPIDTSYFISYFKQKEYTPSSTIIAKDAVALIANNSRKGMKITIDEFAKICRGEMTNFSQLSNGNGGGKITLVFDHPASSTVQYIQDSVLKGGQLTPNAYAQKTNEEVMKYVKNNPNAIGVIGANWISDGADEENIEFSKEIFPVEIRDAKTSQHYYSPHPGYIASHLYPMRRLMRATLKENGAGLGRGFLNFMTGEVGQRIVLKSGIVPAQVLTRVVETRPQM